MNEMMKKMFEPSEKVQKMYVAIAAFVEEKRDLSTVKVSEITSRAGIGKGTAYEYFSSKEEILVHAAMWLCGRQMNQMFQEISRKNGFREKFLFLLEWIEKHKEYNELLLKAIKGSFQGDCDKLKDSVSKELAEQVKDYIEVQINELMEQGCKEGVFTEKNTEKRILVFMGTLMQYGFGTMNMEEWVGMSMTKTELRSFAYECMVKALN